jgi:hypothetical protein
MSAKYTPGPWVAPKRAAALGDVCTEDGHKVCMLWGMNSLPEGSPRANARLIAAAPELLEACKELLAFIDFVGKTQDESIPLARAAIAKATGSAA